MEKVIDTRDHSSDERLDRWCASVSDALGPMAFTVTDSSSFHGELRAARFGSVGVSSVATSPAVMRRTPALIRRHDPDSVVVALCVRGNGGITQDRRLAPMRAGDMSCYSTGRPYRAVATADRSPLVHAITAAIPRALIPVKPDHLDQAMATTLSSNGGPGTLLHGFLHGLATGDTRYEHDDAVRLGNVLIDLLCVALAQALRSAGIVPRDVGARMRVRQVKEYIAHHLDDPGLSPVTVAAAQQLSLRSLHRLFEHERSGVAGWIRAERLERCRRVLLDPALSHLPIDAVAARCGLGDRTLFQWFQAIHGMTPGEYRHLHTRPGTR